MVRRTLPLVGLASLLVTPVAAQFGVVGDRKKHGTTFEEINEMAKKHMKKDGEGGAGAGLAGLGKDINMEDFAKAWADTMNDPAMKETMESLGGDVEKAMESLSKMSPEELLGQVQESLKMLTDADLVDSIVGQKDAVLKNLEESGLVSEEELEKMKNDPEAFEKQMRDSFDTMKDIFSDPETLNAAAKMMKGFSDVIADPEKATKQLADMLKEDLSDDDKIEEARLQLLSNPDLAGNPMLASMFSSDEMKDVLNDPVKWRETVKKGQGMLLGEEVEGAGAGVGEL